MAETRPTLPQRVTAVLRARQYVVFFAIGLFALDVAVPLVSAWLYRRAAFPDILENTRGALADAVASQSLVIAGLFLAFIVTKAWLRAGYVRSLTGPFHLGAADFRQFARLLGLEAILQAIAAAAVGALVLGGDNLEFGAVVLIALFALYLALMYADYIVVLAGVGPIRAIVVSWRTVRSAFLVSGLVLLAVSLAGDTMAQLLSGAAASALLQALPILLVQCLVMGVVLFAADVVLVVVYLSAVESGRVTPEKGGPSASSQG